MPDPSDRTYSDLAEFWHRSVQHVPLVLLGNHQLHQHVQHQRLVLFRRLLHGFPELPDHEEHQSVHRCPDL